MPACRSVGVSACLPVITFIVGMSVGVSVCRVCVSTCGYVRGVGLLMVLLLVLFLDVDN